MMSFLTWIALFALMFSACLLALAVFMHLRRRV